MSTKFSKTRGTQTLPPVCHPPVILPPGWLPPTSPKIRCFIEWEVKKYDDSIFNHKLTYSIKWVPEDAHWFGGDASGPWYISTVLGPPEVGQPLSIATSVDTVLAPVMIYIRSGPVYWPAKPWIADGEKILFPAHPGYVWQAMSTWPT